MSFNVDSHQGLASMAQAKLTLDQLEEELKKAEAALAIYMGNLQNEITQEVDNIFRQIRVQINIAKKAIDEKVEDNENFFHTYNALVEKYSTGGFQ